MKKNKYAKAGQPEKYDPGYCESLITHMRDGLSYEAFAGHVGVCIATLYNWEKDHPEFLEAKRRGVAVSLLHWEKVGNEGMHGQVIKDQDGMTVTKTINSAIWIFNMKNRFKWRDQPKDDTKNASDSAYADMTEEELDLQGRGDAK